MAIPQTIERFGPGGGRAVAHLPSNDLFMQQSAACRVVIDDQDPEVDERVFFVRGG